MQFSNSNFFNFLRPCDEDIKTFLGWHRNFPGWLGQEEIFWAFPVKLSSGECHKTPLMINQHWFRLWLDAFRQQTITRVNIDLDLCHHFTSLDRNELMSELQMVWYWIYTKCSTPFCTIFWCYSCKLLLNPIQIPTVFGQTQYSYHPVLLPKPTIYHWRTNKTQKRSYAQPIWPTIGIVM